jgi:hypothetical protein
VYSGSFIHSECLSIIFSLFNVLNNFYKKCDLSPKERLENLRNLMKDSKYNYDAYIIRKEIIY